MAEKKYSKSVFNDIELKECTLMEVKLNFFEKEERGKVILFKIISCKVQLTRNCM